MLIEFKVANYRSFCEEQTFSMVAGRDKTHPENLIACNGFFVSKAAAIYGANASGKSNLIKAMKAMERFILTSATQMNLGDPVSLVSPFRLNTESRGKPSRFEITVLVEKSTYIYGFSATSERVHEEWLRVRRPGGRLSTWLERTLDPESKQTKWQIKGPLKKDAELLQSKTRDNGLFLSRGAELNIESLAPLFLWFRKHFFVLDLSFPPMGLAQSTAKRAATDQVFRSRIIQAMRDADFGITNISVSEESALKSMPEEMPEELRGALTELTKYIGDHKMFSVTTQHPVYKTSESVNFSLEEDESNGTQRFFALAGPVFIALQDGDVLVVDELDCSMHPLLTRKLVELFQSTEANKNGAQLIFATHDSSVMDSTLFRRDQIWLTEKRRNGSTDLFSLYDFEAGARPRKGEALERNYLAGRYGAVPKLGPTFEDLEVK